MIARNAIATLACAASAALVSAQQQDAFSWDVTPANPQINQGYYVYAECTAGVTDSVTVWKNWSFFASGVQGAGNQTSDSTSGSKQFNAEGVDEYSWIYYYGDTNVSVDKIPQSAPTVTSSQSFTYGNSYNATASGGGGQGGLQWERTGGTASGGAIHSSTGAVSANSIGTVTVRARWLGNSTYEASPWSSAVNITVNARAITLTRTGSKTYNGNTTSTGAGATISSGSLAQWGGGANADAINSSFGNTSSANVGNYAITVTPTISNIAAPTNRTSSYSITYAGTYAINKAFQTGVGGSLNPSAVTYPSTSIVTASGGQGSGTYEFRQNGGTGAVSFSGTGNSRTITPTAVGNATIEVRKLGDGNHYDSGWVSAGILYINAPDEDPSIPLIIHRPPE